MHALFLGPVGDFFNLILNPLYYAVSGVMLAWHWLFSQIGMDPEGGAAWALSIIGLTLVIRACLIPLFVKQIKASRNMQLIQPKVKELQKKYGHDRERLAQETMKLYKDSGTNPFASCLPILLQMPIFFALFRLIDEAADGVGHGFLSEAQAEDFGQAKIFGVLPIAASFTDSRGHALGPDRGRLPGAGDDRDDVPDPAAADGQEHADGRADRSLRPAAEDAALRAARWSSRSVASRSRSACSSTGPPPTCGRWASSST